MSAITLSILNQHPNKAFRVLNDANVKKLLFELGLLDKFSGKVPGVQYPVESVTGHCSTHYIFALRFSGQPKPEDNGYAVYCLPKIEGPEKASQFVKDTLQQLGEHVLSKPFSQSSSAN